MTEEELIEEWTEPPSWNYPFRVVRSPRAKGDILLKHGFIPPTPGWSRVWMRIETKGTAFDFDAEIPTLTNEELNFYEFDFDEQHIFAVRTVISPFMEDRYTHDGYKVGKTYKSMHRMPGQEVPAFNRDPSVICSAGLYVEPHVHSLYGALSQRFRRRDIVTMGVISVRFPRTNSLLVTRTTWDRKTKFRVKEFTVEERFDTTFTQSARENLSLQIEHYKSVHRSKEGKC